ncbi:MAG TPA: tetratricopeptide repeat protein [Chthonomonas sp.]|uniref:tetratricopeptide repeat protein n=1 Tax=Chthonomonas sp. TaxID=2282153 RepID=UPI002B4B601F|nr:tetratricopeptide repeat protein [Chthonomonas sp.]HLI49654.1 tetratricopeptide repeat protein [Chthonomonas sp.]
MKLPSGMVTLLFTDIEGSTRMMEQEPEAMMRLLAQHDALVRRAIEEQGGIVFKALGDGFCAVFSQASAAVQAAVEIQKRLHTADWTPFSTFKVRIALHCGEVVLRDGEYFGTSLARIARLCDLAHGGQVLLTQAVVSRIQDRLPQSASLKDLGVVALRGLQRPERVFQLSHPEIPAHFPSKSFGVVIENIPSRLTSFIERPGEMEQLMALFANAKPTRLLTLLGPGGCGKTRLAQELAIKLTSHFGDGIWWIDLASIASSQLIVPKILATLGLRETDSTSSTLDYLEQELRTFQTLLILDNCEHFLSELAPIVERLLHACRNIAVVATSREALRIAGEKIWQVRPLSVPPRSTKSPSTMAAYEAVQLWVDRAKLSDPTFALTEENASIVGEICQSLDGIPLAIELAAARTGSLSLERIARDLRQNLRFLTTGGARETRHDTMENAIRWSYDLLSADEQEMLQALSVFSGSFTLEAAEAIAFQREDALDLLLNLVEKSLVNFENTPKQSRYRLLEVIRLFAAERLAESGRIPSVHKQYLQFYSHLAQQAAQGLRGAEQAAWLARLDAEYDNLRTALRYALDPETRLGLAVPLYQYWYLRSRFTEGRSWLEGALLRSSTIPPKLRADALNCAGILAWAQGDCAAALRFHTESLELCREIGDREGEARAFNGLALAAQKQSDFPQTRFYLEQSLQIFRETNPRAAAQVLVNLGGLSTEMGDLVQAKSYFEEAIQKLKTEGDKITLLTAFYNLGELHFQQQDYTNALRCYKESLQLFQYHPIPALQCRTFDSLAYITYSAYKNAETAALLLGMAQTFVKDTEAAALLTPQSRQIEKLIATLGAQIGTKRFEELCSQAETLTPSEAFTFGMEHIDNCLKLATNKC